MRNRNKFTYSFSIRKEAVDYLSYRAHKESKSNSATLNDLLTAIALNDPEYMGYIYNKTPLED